MTRRRRRGRAANTYDDTLLAISALAEFIYIMYLFHSCIAA